MSIDLKQLQFMQENHKTVQRVIESHNQINRLLEERMAQVNDDIVVLASLKERVIGRERLLTWQGCRLSKIHFQAGPVEVWYQFGRTDDYKIATHFWVVKDQAVSENLINQLKLAGCISEKFTLSMPADEIVAAVEKTMLSMIAFLSNEQALLAAL